nr:MAG TPA: hypothetical protein [Caudoviricetes sp.]DAH53256.1 MAG TPA: hypothetical protein [Caudoviricetes sp.]
MLFRTKWMLFPHLSDSFKFFIKQSSYRVNIPIFTNL